MKTILYSSALMVLFASCGSKVENNNVASKPAMTADTVKPKDDIEYKPVSVMTQGGDTVPLPKALNSFVLPKHDVLKYKKGDLNNDKSDDFVIILENKEGNGDAARPVLLVTQNTDGTYKLAAKNDSVVGCKNCGGKMDPVAGISIKNGFFTLEQEGGSREMWTKYITFKFDAAKNNWLLHRIDESAEDTLDPKSKENYKKTKTTKEFGVVQFSDFKDSNF